MSDDSFIREVSEELRQDRIKAIWTRFGAYIIAAVALIVLVTAVTLGWQRYTEWQANASGDRYMGAISMAEAGDTEGALAALTTLSEDGYGPYPDLARMSLGGILADEGRIEEAVAAFDAASADGSIPEAMRDMAALRAAYLLVDSGDVAAVRQRVEALTGDAEPMRFAAREAIAATAWAAGEDETARDLYAALQADGETPQGIAGRAGIVLGLIEGAAPPAAPAPTPEPAAPAETPRAAPGTGEAAAPEAGPETAPQTGPQSGSEPAGVLDTQ